MLFSKERTPLTTVGIDYRFYDDSHQIISSGNIPFSPPLLPEEFALRQNFPNPFNSVTTIAYELPERSHVEIIVYDLMGRQVRTLVDEEMGAGFHAAVWNGKDDSGRTAASGTFILQMRSGPYRAVRKMVLLR